MFPGGPGPRLAVLCVWQWPQRIVKAVKIPGWPHEFANRHLGLIKGPYTPQRGLIGEFLTNFRRPKMTRKTILNPPKPPPNGSKMVPKCDPRW